MNTKNLRKINKYFTIYSLIVNSTVGVYLLQAKNIALSAKDLAVQQLNEHSNLVAQIKSYLIIYPALWLIVIGLMILILNVVSKAFKFLLLFINTVVALKIMGVI